MPTPLSDIGHARVETTHFIFAEHVSNPHGGEWDVPPPYNRGAADRSVCREPYPIVPRNPKFKTGLLHRVVDCLVPRVCLLRIYRDSTWKTVVGLADNASYHEAVRI